MPSITRSVRRLAALLVLLLAASASLSAIPAMADAPAAGAVWTARSAAEANLWRSVTYGNGTFVAVASNGTNEVMTSTDGVTWTARAASEANFWTSVTFGNGLFVAVANTGTNRVMTSPDGMTWTAHAASEANPWRSVTYGDGTFVAVAGSGTSPVMTSSDGATWTARVAEESFWTSVTYADGRFVAVAIDGTNRVMTSTDGVAWTARSAAEANAWFSVTYGSGVFVAVANTGTNRVMTSPDGVAWTARSAAEANAWYSVTYGSGAFVAVASDGTNRVMTSPDGMTWTARSAAEANSWRSVTYVSGMFVAIAQSGTNRVMTSGSLMRAPSAPSSPLATVGSGSASIAFTPADDGGSAITKYQVKVGTGSWADAGTTSPINVSGLTNYSTAQVWVRAVNAIGSSPASVPVSVRPRAAGPSLDVATATGRRSIHVEYSGVTILGATIRGYTATAYLKGTETAVSTCNTGRNGRACDLNTLKPATEYDVRVVAYLNLTGDAAVRQTLDSNTRTISTTS